MRVLIIGDVQKLATEFASQGALVRLFKDVVSYRQVVDEVFSLETDLPVVVGDLSLIRESGRLAKFLEEAAPERIVCLASRDCFDSVVLARISRKVKDPSIPEFSGSVDVVKAVEAATNIPVRWDKVLENDPFDVPMIMGAVTSSNRRRALGLL